MPKEPDTRLQELQECYDIVLKTARRVTRDLRHAIDHIPADNEFKGMMQERYRNFALIFDDIRDYRVKLHIEISRLEGQVRSATSDYKEWHPCLDDKCPMCHPRDQGEQT